MKTYRMKMWRWGDEEGCMERMPQSDRMTMTLNHRDEGMKGRDVGTEAGLISAAWEKRRDMETGFILRVLG